jgi:ATP/maltotriose-dependent transcriptional regulator MalT
MDDPGALGDPASSSSPPIIRAKLRPAPTHALKRERLERFMAQVPRRRLTLIVGPAGSGKTTLLSHLASSADLSLGG